MSQELLITLGALLVIAILIDGVRRARKSRYDRIRMSKRKQPIFDDDADDGYGSELPNGGARVVSVRDEDDAEQLHGKIREAAEDRKPKLAFQKSESLEADNPQVDAASERLEARSSDPEPEAEQSELESRAEQPKARSPEPAAQKPKPEAQKQKPQQTTLELTQPSKSSGAPQDVIVFHLRAGSGKQFAGQALLETLVEEGMRFGAMDIFHRHSEADGSGDVLFSMANSMEPGTFDLNTIDELQTPGVSFFMDLTAVDDPKSAFSTLLETIAGCMEKLGGELKDETRSAVTKQTVEHYKQRVRDFQRRALSERA
ncbi:cell division protein ZipA [bacterium SCSIO 12696]|nr:cell division protein ZipA [bacterium SCSIO 12696]